MQEVTKSIEKSKVKKKRETLKYTDENKQDQSMQQPLIECQNEDMNSNTVNTET